MGKPATNPNDHIQAVKNLLLLPEKLPDHSLDIISGNCRACNLAADDDSQASMAETIGLSKGLKEVTVHRASMLENGTKFIRSMQA
jgi:hypothetical protein